MVADGTHRRPDGDPESLTGPVPRRAQRAIPVPENGAPATARRCAMHGARENNLKNVDVRDPARQVRLRHRRLGLGQEHAGQRDALQALAQRALQRPRAPRRARPHRGPGAPRQGHRHRPVAHRPHAALQPGDLHRRRSRRSASCSPRCPKRACAATSRAASPSTSRAAAARPARARASSRSRCSSCPTCTCPARSARAAATTARRWRSTTRARRSPKCST